jgi:hypothetical protein
MLIRGVRKMKQIKYMVVLFVAMVFDIGIAMADGDEYKFCVDKRMESSGSEVLKANEGEVIFWWNYYSGDKSVATNFGKPNIQ